MEQKEILAGMTPVRTKNKEIWGGDDNSHQNKEMGVAWTSKNKNRKKWGC
jgi:hypothetical protein